MISIKICGLTILKDALWALEQGADYLGFVLYPESPRHVTLREFVRLKKALPETARCVAVFVNEDAAMINRIAAECALAAVQVHGEENPLDFGRVKVPVWRAIRLRDGNWSPAPAEWTPERFVMDAFSPAYGGTGKTVDWQVAKTFSATHRAMLAGGLNPENVGEAVRRVRPLGVDVASGVESGPGRKDPRKVTAFIKAARAADGQQP
jgi:phosphoribosylanthranilate isomerase